MSNGAVTSACCCGQNCQTECCDWWACSPTGEINVVLTGSKVVNRTITPGGQTWVQEEISWSITATMVKTGSSCSDYANTNLPNLFRYEAQTCEFSWERITRFYDPGERSTCSDWCVIVCCFCPIWWCGDDSQYTGPGLQASPEDPCGTGDPCTLYYYPDLQPFCFDINTGVVPGPGNLTRASCRSWNCLPYDESVGCDGWGCRDVVEFRLVQEITESWTGTLVGKAIPLNPGTTCEGRYKALMNPATDPVLTIACYQPPPPANPYDCGSECVRPILLFNPDSSNVYVLRVEDRTMDPCCNADPCLIEDCYVDSTSIQPWSIKEFAILGKGSCLDGTTFEEPTTAECLFPTPHWALGGTVPTPPSGEWIDMLGIGDTPCQPLSRTEGFKECRDETYMQKNLYYCGRSAGFAEGCETDEFEFCYWNPWCEVDETPVVWGWSMTEGGT